MCVKKHKKIKNIIFTFLVFDLILNILDFTP